MPTLLAGALFRNATRLYERWTSRGGRKPIKVMSVSYGEAHDNKTSLDTHFAFVGPALRRYCVANKACVSTAGAGAAARANSDVGVRGTHVFEFAPAAAIEVSWAFENCIRYDKATFVHNVTVVADDGTECEGSGGGATIKGSGRMHSSPCWMGVSGEAARPLRLILPS